MRASVAAAMLGISPSRVHALAELTVTREDGRQIKLTPAMAAGVADHPWSVYELVGLLESN